MEESRHKRARSRIALPANRRHQIQARIADRIAEILDEQHTAPNSSAPSPPSPHPPARQSQVDSPHPPADNSLVLIRGRVNERRDLLHLPFPHLPFFPSQPIIISPSVPSAGARSTPNRALDLPSSCHASFPSSVIPLSISSSSPLLPRSVGLLPHKYFAKTPSHHGIGYCTHVSYTREASPSQRPSCARHSPASDHLHSIIHSNSDSSAEEGKKGSSGARVGSILAREYRCLFSCCRRV